MRTLRLFDDGLSQSDKIRLEALEQGQNYLSHKVNNIENQLEQIGLATKELEETENRHFEEMRMAMDDYNKKITTLRRQLRSGCWNNWNLRTKIIVLFLFVWFVYMMFSLPQHLIKSAGAPV